MYFRVNVYSLIDFRHNNTEILLECACGSHMPNEELVRRRRDAATLPVVKNIAVVIPHDENNGHRPNQPVHFNVLSLTALIND